jgi:alkylation response protein AidB-like acyl-CoA dehydrogenase
VVPYLPAPWGRSAAPLEQILISQEVAAADLVTPSLMIGAWVVPTLVKEGTPAQRERFLPPTLRGGLVWCQLFSEPGAGSDLAGLRTRAERVPAGDGPDGRAGWKLYGQKVWTSLAREAQWGICLARTDPEAPKHKGITYFLVDMSDPGIEIRPLKEITGDAFFNEVFLDGVFVPDDMVVGEVNDGWRVARGTLDHERVNLSIGWQLGASLGPLVDLIGERGLTGDAVVRDRLGRLAADAYACDLLSTRVALRQLSGIDPGPTSSVRKLVGMRHGQQLTDYGWSLFDAESVIWSNPAENGGGAAQRRDRRRDWNRWLFAVRAMTIGGGTTEVLLNVIGERILGLPRDAQV